MLPSFYTSAEFLDLEKEFLFRKEWICVRHVNEIPRIGDYFTSKLVGEPLLICRAQDGVIRIYSNVCRHRGNLVSKDIGNARSSICGYHGWTYGLDGPLKTAPFMRRVKTLTPENADCRNSRQKYRIISSL